jgi:hypothetical protein
MEDAVVRHQTGTVAVEGEQVVIRMSGKGWQQELKVPVRHASARTDRDNRELTTLEVYERDAPVQVLMEAGPPDAISRFLDELEDAQQAAIQPAAYARCPNCGAPNQQIGKPCRYCRS